MSKTKLQQLVKSAKGFPLAEAFLLTAIESYSRQVLADDSDWGKSFINKEAWQEIAQENLTMLGENEEGEHE